MKVTINTPQGPRTVGSVNDGVFTKTAKASKHFFRNKKAWGIQASVIPMLKEIGVDKVVINETENNCIYSTTVKAFLQHGELNDFGYGPQILLPLGFWKLTSPGQTELFGQVK